MIPILDRNTAMSEAGQIHWFQIENTEAERIALTGACSMRMQRRTHTRRWQLLPVWVLLGGLIGWFAGDEAPFTGLNSYAMLGFWVVLMAIQFVVFRTQLRSIASSAPAEYRLGIGEGQFTTESSSGRFDFPWSVVEAIERRSSLVMLHLKGFRALCFPQRCFSSEDEFAEFIARLERATGLVASSNPVSPRVIPEKRGLEAFRDLVSNLRAGAQFCIFRSDAPAHLRVSVLQIVLLVVLRVLIGLAYDFSTVGLEGQFYWYALPYQLFGVLAMLLCAWVVANCSLRQNGIPVAVVAMLAPSLILQIASIATVFLYHSTLPVSLIESVGWFIFVWAAVATMVALVRTLEMAAEQRLAAALGVIVVYSLTVFFHQSDARLWVQRYSESEEDAASASNKWEQASQESVLYAQPALLEKAMSSIKQGREGVPEIYLLALAGYGSQDVFKREVDSVESLFADRFDTQGHSVVLVNNPATVEERPIASTIALKRSLMEIGRKMNRDEDVLFLFMTSHGAADHKFSLNLWPYRFGDLTPTTLRDMLDESGIQNRVIVVSACYSGGFIQPLADAHTLVMSASRDDRNSHGCSHEAEWTFFGKAYFDEALRKTRSFTDAFAQARLSVAEREKAEGYEASEPQISTGEAIQPLLRRIESRLGG